MQLCYFLGAVATVAALFLGAHVLGILDVVLRRRRVLVVGSINVDLYQRLSETSVTIDGNDVDVKSVKGMTLPAASFVDAVCTKCQPGREEEHVLRLVGPFTQKTGGKGANAAAAAGQTFPSEFIGNLGSTSADANLELLADLRTYGAVSVSRCAVLDGIPTGTAYILLFRDSDNAIVLLGGANQRWPSAEALLTGAEGAALRRAVASSATVMLQREIPPHVNVAVAQLAHAMGAPVFMDVGGTDAPIDSALMPYLSVVAPNESELSFISGVQAHDGGTIRLDRVRHAVAALRARFAEATRASPCVEVLVTLGGVGSIHFGADWEPTDHPDAHETWMGVFALGTPDGQPVDTTGAGDCFRGSYVAARYGEGKSVWQAMRWAAAAASLSVEVEGAMPSMPARRAIEARAQAPLLGLDGPFWQEEPPPPVAPPSKRRPGRSPAPRRRTSSS